jgi:exonuclease III
MNKTNEIQPDHMIQRKEEMNTQLKYFYTNADSLINKHSELELTAFSAKPDTICITEVSPKNSETKVEDSEIQIPGYYLHSNLKEGRRGVAILLFSQVTI